MKILVTGASGFIGSHMAEGLANDGHEVVGCARAGCEFAGVEPRTVNLLDYGAVQSLLSSVRPDAVVHCAGCANVSKSVEDPVGDFQGNVTATQNLLFSLNGLGLNSTRVLFLSSAGVYGNPDTLPITEEAKLAPLSPYALHKGMTELTCRFMANNHGMDVRIARIFSAYGPGLRKQLFWDMFKKARDLGRLPMWGTGRETRDYIYIDDLVAALKLVLFDEGSASKVFNVANGVEVSIAEAARCFASAMGIDESLIEFNGADREGDPINWRADVTRLEGLGYAPTVSIKDGVARYVDWALKESEGK